MLPSPASRTTAVRSGSLGVDCDFTTLHLQSPISFDEMLTHTAIALLASAVIVAHPCSAAPTCSGDFNDDQMVTIDEVVRAVSNLLVGCPPPNSRFVDNRDGTITDTRNGLMWEKKSEYDGEKNYANLHDADNSHPWAGHCSRNGKYCQPTAEAVIVCLDNSEVPAIGCETCAATDGECNNASTIPAWLLALNTANFGGHRDWRLPTRQELTSLVDYTTHSPAVDAAFHGSACGSDCTDINSPDCSCTIGNFFLSTSIFLAAAPEYLWIVSFGDGRLENSQRDDGYFARAVRGGP